MTEINHPRSRATPLLHRSSIAQILVSQGRVLHALMLRDIRTRFGSALGFLLVVAWPLSHILLLMIINLVAGRVAPYGDNAAVWFATGIVPFMCFSYMARFTMLGVLMNKPLLSFSVLKVMDILFARALIEILNAGLVIIILCIILWSFGIHFLPFDIPQACYALLASLLLGLGFGVLNGIIAAITPMWVTGYALLSITLWLSSGVLFVPDSLPASARELLALQPTLHLVEWMRASYYEGYGSEILDKSYVLTWGVVTLFLGMAIERLVRGRLLIIS